MGVLPPLGVFLTPPMVYGPAIIPIASIFIVCDFFKCFFSHNHGRLGPNTNVVKTIDID